MSSRHFSHTDYLTTGLNFSINSRPLANKDIAATIKDAVKDLGKEEADMIRAKTKPYNSNFHAF